MNQVYNQIYDIPATGPWKLPPLYKPSAIGRTRYWTIEFDGVENIIVKHGYCEGKEQVEVKQVKTNSTGRSIFEQAKIKGLSEYETKKRKNEYSTNPDQEQVLNNLMRGKNWEGINKDKPLKQTEPITCYPVVVSPKLDGHRCSVHLMNNKVMMLSSGNKEKEFFISLKEELYYLLLFLPDGTRLDGELYNHDAKFNDIQSAATQSVNIDNEKQDLIQYHIFDLFFPRDFAPETVPASKYGNCSGPYYEDRIAILTKAVNTMNDYLDNQNINRPSHIFFINIAIANNAQEVEDITKYYLSLKFEGSIIRYIGCYLQPGDKWKSLYNHTSRSTSILKHKPTCDGEGLVVNVVDSEGSERGFGLLVLDYKGHQFKMRTGSEQWRAYILNNPQSVIGQYVKFIMKEETHNGIPREPQFHSFRPIEDMRFD